MPLFRTLMACATLLLLAMGPTAQAQNIGPATDYVTWTTTVDPATVAQGQTARVVFAVTIDDGWKMYALGSPAPSRAVAVTFDALPNGLALQGAMQQTGAKEGYDPNFEKAVVYFEKEGVLWADVAVAADADEGARAMGGTIHFMICTDRLCLPPTDVPFAATVRVGTASGDAPRRADGVAAPPAMPTTPPPLFVTDSLSGLGLAQVPAPPAGPVEPSQDATLTATTDLDTARSGGLWSFILLAMGAGLAALLTPCVFPMIPLTVSYFTKHSDDRREALRMAMVYGGAIVLTFTGLGVLMAVLVGAAGAQSFAANPWVNLLIGLVFIVFALALLGLFELRLPSGLLNFFNRKSNEKQGYAGVLFMGFTLTLVSFSCTAPFVGGLLAATSMGSWSYPVLGMVVFSATFSLPFMFFALFPRALSALPQSGSWMNVVKVVLGFVELAAALKFLSNADLVWGWGLISRTLAIALVVVIFFLTGLYLLGKLRLKHEPAVEHIGVGRLLASMAFFGLSIYLIPGLLGAPLNKLDAYLPPRQAGDVSVLATMQSMMDGGPTHLDDAWITDDIEAAFAQAAAQSKPVMIDFTGYTCTNCREMEANVFTRPEVAERFDRNFVLLRLYTDGIERGQEFQRFQMKLTGTVALPTYAIVSPFEQQKPIARISGVVAAEQFASFLDRGTASFLEQSLAARD